jgi:hypothetical protein
MSPPTSRSKYKLSRNPALLENCFMLVSCLAYSSTLKLEETCSSETPADFQRTTRRYIPEDGTLHNHRCENLNSYIFLTCSWILFVIARSTQNAKMQRTRVETLRNALRITLSNLVMVICVVHWADPYKRYLPRKSCRYQTHTVQQYVHDTITFLLYSVVIIVVS